MISTESQDAVGAKRGRRLRPASARNSGFLACLTLHPVLQTWLMPFAPISKRIGNAVTVCDPALLLGFFNSQAQSPHITTQKP